MNRSTKFKKVTLSLLVVIFIATTLCLFIGSTNVAYANTEDNYDSYTLNWGVECTDKVTLTYDNLEIFVKVGDSFICQTMDAQTVISFMQQDIRQIMSIYIINDTDGNTYVINYTRTIIHNLEGKLISDEDRVSSVVINNSDDYIAGRYIGEDGLANMFNFWSLSNWDTLCDMNSRPIVSNTPFELVTKGFGNIREDFYYMVSFEVTDINSTITGVDTLPEICKDYKSLVQN